MHLNIKRPGKSPFYSAVQYSAVNLRGSVEIQESPSGVMDRKTELRSALLDGLQLFNWREIARSLDI